jgi:transketolase
MEKTSALDSGLLNKINSVAWGIRKRVMAHTISNSGGYLSQACSSAEILSTLYCKIMCLGQSQAPKIPPLFPGVPGKGNVNYFTGAAYNGPVGPDYDRFLLSPAHYALVLYATLIETGRMDENGLEHFNKDGSIVEMIGAEHSPGFEMMGGALAQTLSQAAGIAFARKRKKDRGRIWVFLSDGEFQEGQTWEAVQAMSFYKLDNIGVYIDINGQQCDGKMDMVMNLEPLAKRIEAFGGRAVAVDGHNIEALAAPADLIPDERPLFVLCYTDPCRGFPILEKRRPKLHYVRFTSVEEKDEYRLYFESLMRNHQELNRGLNSGNTE